MVSIYTSNLLSVAIVFIEPCVIISLQVMKEPCKPLRLKIKNLPIEKEGTNPLRTGLLYSALYIAIGNFKNINPYSFWGAFAPYLLLQRSTICNSCNMGTSDLPDISALDLGRCAPEGLVHCAPEGLVRIYQANHECACYNRYVTCLQVIFFEVCIT